MKEIKFAVIGLGNMGKIHAANLLAGRVKGVVLTSACDIDREALDWGHKNLPGVNLYQDYQEMLKKEKLDAVVVVTPHYSHIQIAIDCLKAHLHVLVEKPLAVTAMEGKTLVDLHASCPDLVAGVAFNQRSNNVYKEAKKLLPQLGTIRSARYEISDWYRPDSYYRMNPWRGSYSLEGGGALINQCHHQLDLMVWLFGLPLKVKATTQTIDRQITGENDVLALLSYPTFTLVFSASLHDLKGINYMDVSGDKGRLDIYKTKMKAYFHEDEPLANKEAELYGGVTSKTETYYYGYKRLKEDKLYGQQVRSLRAFAGQIRGESSQLGTLEDGLKDVQLLNAIYLSGWTGKEVELPVDEEVYKKALEAKAALEKK